MIYLCFPLPESIYLYLLKVSPLFPSTYRACLALGRACVVCGDTLLSLTLFLSLP